MASSSVTEDGTVAFVPERLNRDPVVVRGLTNDELFAVVGAGCVVGLLIGILALLLSGEVALLPTCLFGGGGLSLLLGGAMLRRAKRGKPETWLYRRMQWWLAVKTGISPGSPLITRNGYWAVRREQRERNRVPSKEKKGMNHESIHQSG